MGEIVTFYSYKGGAGRSMCLANVAVLLARWGYKVLAIDLDLEAPGLENFFAGSLDSDLAHNARGMVDLLSDAMSSGQWLGKSHWLECTLDIALPRVNRFQLRTAGQRSETYFRLAHNLDFGDSMRPGMEALSSSSSAMNSRVRSVLFWLTAGPDSPTWRRSARFSYLI